MKRTIVSPRVNELVRSPLREYLDLNGLWDFCLDPDKQGEAKGYPAGKTKLEDTIVVPGCLEAQRKGLTYGPITQPAWAGTSDLPYFGMSWYSKSFELPAQLAGKQLMLNFGGVSTDCKIWLDGEFLYEHHYGSIGFGIDITGLSAGIHTLVVQVENRHTYEVKTPTNIHGFGSSTTEMRWSGIYRGVELVAVDNCYLQDLYLRPNAKSFTLTVDYQLSQPADKAELTVSGLNGEALYSKATAIYAANGSITLPMPGAELWSDDTPVLYLCTLKVIRDGAEADSLTERFGLRDIDYDGKHILLNGVPVYLRGEMTHFHWPDSISPCTDREDLRKKLGVYREYGMNFLRHHTFFPHPEYLDVCDELGLLCHNELGVTSFTWAIEEEHAPAMWHGSILGCRNHPAVIIWCMGNEYMHLAVDKELPTPEQIDLYKSLTFSLDSTRLLQDNSPGFFHFADGRPPQRVPIYHEVRRSGASYIDPAAKRHYTGALRPWRMLWAEERTKEAGIDHLLPKFVANTQKLQALTRKHVLEDIRLNYDWIEEYRHIPRILEGYELATFRDSGSFTWGTVDDYCGKKAVSGEEFRQYNDATVLLWELRWFDRVLEARGRMTSLPISIACSHYGKQTMKNATLRWRIIKQDGTVLAQKEIAGLSAQRGSVGRLCDDSIHFPTCESPEQMKLEADLEWSGGHISNCWDFWIFPGERIKESTAPIYDHKAEYALKLWLRQRYSFITPADGDIPKEAILITSEVDDTLLSHLEQGGRALLAGRNCFAGEVTEFGAARSEYARGTIIADHPLGKLIPNDGYCDIPFHMLINGCKAELNGMRRNDLGFAIGLRSWPKELVPIVAGIPSYKSAQPQLLSHLMEVCVGKGKLLITTFQFSSIVSERDPAGSWLLDQILLYMQGDEFNPAVQISGEFLRDEAQYSKTSLDKPAF